MTVFNEEKFKEVLHFIISECGHKPHVGRTVLYKLLYFSDFDFYELYEEKMTGESYRKIEQGPAPKHFENAKKELIREGKINEEVEYHLTYHQYRYSSLTKPDLKLLDKKEIEVINKVITKCSDMNATEISSYSHRDIPYTATANKNIINYDFVFYRDSNFSVREYEDE